MTTQNYYNADYLYSHATVTVGGTTTAYTDDSKFQSGKNTIDLYYYRDSWNKNDGSETGGDGTRISSRFSLSLEIKTETAQ